MKREELKVKIDELMRQYADGEIDSETYAIKMMELTTSSQVDERNVSIYEDESEKLEELKQEDSYHFSIPFEYIKKNYGNDNYEIGIAYMDVDVRWDDYEQGYKMYYSCSDEYLIDQNEGNGDLEDFWDDVIEDKVREELASYGIYTEAICSFASRG